MSYYRFTCCLVTYSLQSVYISVNSIYLLLHVYTHIYCQSESVSSQNLVLSESMSSFYLSCRLILLVSCLFFGNYFRYLSLFLLYILALILVFNSMFDKSPIIIIIIIGIKIDKKIKMQSYSLSSENLCVH